MKAVRFEDITATMLREDPFGFGAQFGYYTDTETGLILCTFRYYDPNTGRWGNRDPIGYGGGVNLYAYVLGNPVNSIDPLGLSDDIPDAQGHGWKRVVIDGFIPTKLAKNAPDGAHGDNRSFSSNSQPFRIRTSFLLKPDHTHKVWVETGTSENSKGKKAKASTNDMSGFASYNESTCEWTLRAYGKAAYPLNRFAPPIDYDLTVKVTNDGAYVSGEHDRYPAYEVWLYRDGFEPSLKYGRKPSPKATVFSLMLPMIKAGK